MRISVFSLIMAVYFWNTSLGHIFCPDECECYFDIDYVSHADCSGKQLQQLPENLDKDRIQLDLSNNLFTSIPPEIESFTKLEKLNMSGNRIEKIGKNSLSNLRQLKVLDLSKNYIESWENIKPNEILEPAIDLRKLILSHNHLKTFSNLNETEYLVSNTLETLELSDCGIVSIGKTMPIKRLNNLKRLILSNNPLRWIVPFVSPTLEFLDVSHCAISYLSPDFFNYLPLLTNMDISNNYRLILRKDNYLSSISLKYFDLSFCNMDGVNLHGLPNLEIVLLRGNMIRILPSGAFNNNSRLEYLDLSSNAIGIVHQNAFQGLNSLKQLNLSINLIPDLHDDVFLPMSNLTELIISRNYLSNINRIRSTSIVSLDLSLCELQFLEYDAFQYISSLLDLNLSRNLISYIPNLKSKSLQTLDLSYNRLSIIDNMTFQSLPELTTLHLSGNRFTSTWRTSYFSKNNKILEISLHDNMWRCDCYDEEMKLFFQYLINQPPKVWDINTLTCHSPSNVSGDIWLKACHQSWYPSIVTQNGKAVNFLLVILGAFFLCFIVLFMVRRTMRKRVVEEEVERQRITTQERERIREIQMRREQEEQRNAPDPRDLISPPSYNEALLMPKLDGSFHSLSDLNTSQKKQKKRARRRTRSSGDLLEENITFEERQKNRRPRKRDNEGGRNRSQSTHEINNTNSEEVQSLHEETDTMTRLHESDL
ncbi:uncharacterized protein LOC143913424 isoform X2 [Arctopsyche grandis]